MDKKDKPKLVQPLHRGRVITALILGFVGVFLAALFDVTTMSIFADALM